MAYLVTGGTGLLGSRIIRDLIREGQMVIAYDLSPDQHMMDVLLTDAEKANVKIVEGDVLDFDGLRNLVKDNRVDTIVHAAAILGKPVINANPRLATRVGTEGTVNIFEIARTLKLRKVVWASSSAVFSGNERGLIVNDAFYHPETLYGACKSFGEYASDYYFAEFGVDITAIRYCGMIFGAGQKRGNSGIIAQELFLNPALAKPGRVPFSDNAMNWLYVDDAARAAILGCKHRRTKTGAFHLKGHFHTIKELSGYVKEFIPNADIELLPGSMGLHYWNMDMSITEKELGYHSQWSTRDGIRETLNMMRLQHGLPPV